ncbi:YeeE/YedE family protein [Marinobacter maritimus]|uniref:YeeE/YedE family protein n=1 Tax=Marinobacter maritimus TaxID=277961 RepID=UPI0011AA208B|nr:YeeE/YedE family protein [Marinobacter maritimus]
MKSAVAALFAGLLFGFGLIVSGMANPEKVLGFLDIAGLWDPSLAFVMGGAVIVGLLAFAIARKRTLSFLGFDMKVPGHSHINKRLIVGGLLFGIGWGIAGICPGPGLVALGAGEVKATVFVASMVAGMGIFELVEHKRAAFRSDDSGERWHYKAPE